MAPLPESQARLKLSSASVVSTTSLVSMKISFFSEICHDPTQTRGLPHIVAKPAKRSTLALLDCEEIACSIRGPHVMRRCDYNWTLHASHA
jgi:hypothetical protein